jgi:DNA-directed RNA polymerase subunit beta'
VPRTFNVWVKDGAMVEIGDQLTDGSLDLQQLYELRGIAATQKYIVKEIQYVYSSQGQPLNDKHIETIARQMFSRIYIAEPGETDFLIGEVIEKSVFDRENSKAKEAGKKVATAATATVRTRNPRPVQRNISHASRKRSGPTWHRPSEKIPTERA